MVLAKNRILVVGATGTVGSQVLAQLMETGAPVRALFRNPDAAGLPLQVEVVRGDLMLHETLDRCLYGIDTASTLPTAQFVQSAGRISPFLQLQSTSVISLPSRSERCVRTDTPERNMF